MFIKLWEIELCLNDVHLAPLKFTQAVPDQYQFLCRNLVAFCCRDSLVRSFWPASSFP